MSVPRGVRLTSGVEEKWMVGGDFAHLELSTNKVFVSLMMASTPLLETVNVIYLVVMDVQF